MAVAYADPFEQWQQELERMVEGAFGSVAWTGVYPPVNVFDAGGDYVLKAELPGVSPESIELDVQDDTVTLRGERAFGDPAREGAYHRRERAEGRFRRVVRVPGRLDSDGVHAGYADGVLTVRLPKAKEHQPRRVQVEAR